MKSKAEDEADRLLIQCEAEDVAPLPDMAITFQGYIFDLNIYFIRT